MSCTPGATHIRLAYAARHAHRLAAERRDVVHLLQEGPDVQGRRIPNRQEIRKGVPPALNTPNISMDDAIANSEAWVLEERAGREVLDSRGSDHAKDARRHRLRP